MKDEIKKLSSLENPFIVKFLHTEEEQNTLAIFLPYMEGVSEVLGFVEQAFVC